MELQVGQTYITPEDCLGDRAGVVIVGKAEAGYKAKVFSDREWLEHVVYDEQGRVVNAPGVEVGNHVWDLE